MVRLLAPSCLKSAEPKLYCKVRGIEHSPSSQDELQSETGVYTIPHVRAGRYIPQVSVGYVIESGEWVNVDRKSPSPVVAVKLPPTGTLVIRAVDRKGRALQDRMIIVNHATESIRPMGDTNARGEHRVVVPVGVYLVAFADPEAGEPFQPMGDPLKVEVRAFDETVVVLRDE